MGGAGQWRERIKQRKDGTGGRVNEPPGDGWQEVGAFHSTDESGEPNLKGPGGGKEAPGHGTGGGKDGEGFEPRNHPNETASDSWAGEFLDQ